MFQVEYGQRREGQCQRVGASMHGGGFRVDLPRPRDINSVTLAEYSTRITQALRAYMQPESSIQPDAAMQPAPGEVNDENRLS